MFLIFEIGENGFGTEALVINTTKARLPLTIVEWMDSSGAGVVKLVAATTDPEAADVAARRVNPSREVRYL